MLKLKHLKTLQHVSISTQIIFRELVVSSLKSLNLKLLKIFLKYKRSIVAMWQQFAINCNSEGRKLRTFPTAIRGMKETEFWANK
jgi:hypothetical protein